MVGTLRAASENDKQNGRCTQRPYIAECEFLRPLGQIYLRKSEPTNKTRAEDACFIRNNDISLQVQKIHINTMLTQQEQDLITETLHQLGIKDEYRFDSYLEAFNWNE